MPDENWLPIDSAPWGEVIEVKNDKMDRPIRATRGYVYNGMVHPDPTFFTSAYTPDRFFPSPAGLLVCPTKWRRMPAEPDHAD